MYQSVYKRAHTCTRDQPPCTFTLVYVCVCARAERAGARVARIHAREIDEQRRALCGLRRRHRLSRAIVAIVVLQNLPDSREFKKKKRNSEEQRATEFRRNWNESGSSLSLLFPINLNLIGYFLFARIDVRVHPVCTRSIYLLKWKHKKYIHVKHYKSVNLLGLNIVASIARSVRK